MRKALAAVVLTVGVVVGSTGTAEARAPKPCVLALDDAETIASISGDYAGAIAAYFASNAQAATTAVPTLTGMTALLQAQTTNTRALTAITNSLADRVTAARASFDAHAKACRKA